MATVSKSVLKAKMLGYLRKVEKSGEELIITDNRKPVLKIVPLQQSKSFEDVFDDVTGKIKYQGALETSTEAEWGDLK